MIVSPETLSNLDMAVFDWLGQLRVDYGKAFASDYTQYPKDLSNYPIFRIMSSAERAFANNLTMMVSQGFIDPRDYSAPDNATEDQHLRPAPLPLVRIQRTSGPLPTTEQHNTPERMRVYHSEGLSYKSYRFPTPYLALYVVEFVSHSKVTMNYLMQWFMDQFTPVGAGVNQAFIPVQNKAPWNEKKAQVEFVSEIDNSEEEDVSDKTDQKDRIIRKTCQLRVRFWNFDLVGEDVPAIFGASADLYDDAKADLDLDNFGDLLATTNVLSREVYLGEPLPDQHIARTSTATRVVTRPGHAPQYSIASGQFVRSISLPFPVNSLVVGRIDFKWRDSHDTPLNLPVRIVWINPTTNVVTTVQQFSVSADSPSVHFITSPQNVSNEVAFQVDYGTETTRLAIPKYRLELVNLSANLFASSIAAGLNPSTSIQNTSLEQGKAYLIRGFVNQGASPATVTLSLFADSGESVLIASIVLSSVSREFSFYAQPPQSTLRLRVATTSATVSVSGIQCQRAPLRM